MRKVIGRPALMLAAALALAGCATLEEGVDRGLSQSYVVSTTGDRNGPNRWKVAGGVVGNKTERLALYRGALLAKANGFAWFQVVNHEASTALGGDTFTIVGVNVASAPLTCEADEWERYYCRTENSEETIQTVAKEMNISSQQVQTDLSLARLQGQQKRKGTTPVTRF